MQNQESVYFRKQPYFSLECGLYSVNHLLGGKIYDKTAFNNICYQLSDDFINPHKHVFGGDFDVNVLMTALDREGYITKWFDSRKGQLAVPRGTDDPNVIGYLINIYSEGAPSFIHKICQISKRHWFTVRRVQDQYFWLDSKQDHPRQLSADKVQLQLNKLLNQHEDADRKAVILTVYKKEEGS